MKTTINNCFKNVNERLDNTNEKLNNLVLLSLLKEITVIKS